MQYRPEIDGLRALAVLPVLLFHANISFFQGGFIGVDIFFVLSGYLICAILLQENRNGTYKISKFYERRARRLLPAFFTVLLVTTIAACILLQPAPLSDYGQSLMAATGIGANYFFYYTLDYFAVAAENWALLHIWSLSVEEQFYIVFPILLTACFRFGGQAKEQWVRALMWGVFFASYALMVTALSRGNENWGFFWTPARAWELLAGGLLALHTHQLPRSPLSKQAGSLLGLALIITAIVTFSPDTTYPDHHTLVPIVGTMLLIAFATPETWVGRLLSLKPLVWIGLISYSLYLWHQPLFALTRLSAARDVLPHEYLMLCVVAVVLATLSYHYVEKPFRNPARTSRRFILYFSVSGLLIAFATGALLYMSNGWPSRVHGKPSLPMHTSNTACLSSTKNPISPGNASCRLNAKSPLSAAVLGDSHSNLIAQELAKASPERGIQQLSRSGCGPALLFNLQANGCGEYLQGAMRYLLAEKSIKDVFLVYRHSMYVKGHRIHGEGRTLVMLDGGRFSETPEDTYLQSLTSMIQTLRANGKRVFLVAPIPELEIPFWQLATPYTVFHSEPRGRMYDNIQHSDYQRRHDWLFQAEPSLTQAGAIQIPLWWVMCKPDSCDVLMKDGTPAYYDQDHPTEALAQKLVAHIRKVWMLAP